MKKNQNSQPQSPQPEQLPRQEDPLYDTTNVGDAALLAVLNSAEASNAEDDAELNAKVAKHDKNGPEKVASNSSLSSDSGKRQPADPDSSKEDAAPQNRPEATTVARLLRLAAQILAGEIPDDDLIPLMDAAAAKEAIEQARKDGERAGRNALIEERLRPREIGAPDLNASPSPRRSKATSIFDLANSAK